MLRRRRAVESFGRKSPYFAGIRGCAFDQSKIAEAEPINFLSVPIVLVALAIHRHRQIGLLMPRPLARLAREWVLFVLAATIITLWLDWRLKFYVPSGMSLFRHPPILTLTRTAKLLIDVIAMFALSSLLAQKPKLVRFAAHAYVGVGLLNASYALVSCLLCLVGIVHGDYEGIWGAYMTQQWWQESVRARGFFVEGGPFGLYMVTVLIVLLFERYVLRSLSRSIFIACAAVPLAALLASRSKAAACLIVALSIWAAFRANKFRQVGLAVFVILLLAGWAVEAGFGEEFSNYWASYELAAELTNLAPQNANIAAGRVAAGYVVPHMIADRPIFGIGFGNYPVERDNPVYSWPLPPSPVWDSGGLGLFDSVAELGVPLFLCFVALVWKPVRMAEGQFSPEIVVTLAGCQFWVLVFGASITFLYPYLTTALALGYLNGLREPA